ncbi:MAG TPA: branched-chain amino acid transaminase [Terriglobia bacterium]|nr:branched-chain amino acid transaminase [Terriglobia bacterium]
MLPKYVFFKDRIVPYSEAKVGVLTHGLNYGTGVFGGLRGYWNDDEEQLFVFRPHDHFERFLQSTRLLCMELPYQASDLVRAMTDLVSREAFREDCYIRPLAFYGDEIIGVKLHGLHPEVSMLALPFGQYCTNEDSMHVTFSSWRRVDDNIIPARGKISGAYVNSAFSKTDAVRAGFDEVLVLNQDGHVSEGSAANLFVLRNGVWATPAITDNVLEGITRRTIIQLMRDELGMSVVERPIDRTEVYLADEAFLCGTGVQISVIGRVDFRTVGSGGLGPSTARIRQIYYDVVKGRMAKYRTWCHPVYGAGTKKSR